MSKIVNIALILLLLFSLSGCGDKNVESESASHPSREEYYALAEKLYEEYGLEQYGISYELEEESGVFDLSLDEFEEKLRFDMDFLAKEQKEIQENPNAN